MEAKVQCSACNSLLGTKLVSQIKKNPSIRLAIRNLKNQLPRLYNSMEEGQEYLVKNANEKKIEVVFKKGKFQTLAHKQADNSLILDTAKGEKNIRKMLGKKGLTEQEVNNIIEKFKKTSDNKIIELTRGLSAARWTTTDPFPKIENPEIDERLIVLIAYNFLCLLLGENIFDQRLNFIRDFILNGTKSHLITVESFIDEKYGCYHKIYPEFSQNETKINIILFRWLIYIIKINFVFQNVPDCVYVENLRNKEGLFAESLEKARQNQFYRIRELIM